jgi:hypothetical protein
VNIPRKVFERDKNLSFNGTSAWELVKHIRVEGYKVNYKKNGLLVDNWLHCNHAGVFVFPLEKEKSAKPKPTPAKPKLKTNDSKPKPKPKRPRRESPVKKNKN